MRFSKVYATGIGCIGAPGNTVIEAMKNIYLNLRNPKPPTCFTTDVEGQYPVFEANLTNDQLREILFSSKNLPNNITRTNLLSLKATEEAINYSHIDLNNFDPKRVGVFIGTTVGSTLNNEKFYRELKTGNNPSIDGFEIFLNNNPALYIKKHYSLKGHAATIANACSSGSDAIGIAASHIENGLCDAAICGGSDELSRIAYLGFISLLVSSRKACRPFDKNRAGLNLGEGAGILILESERCVTKRNALPIAEVISYSSASDAYHPTGPHPDGKGLRNAILTVLNDAGASAGDVDFINAHGTSTLENDRVEGRVLADIFNADTCVVSTKAYTGHTLGAAGGIEAVFTIQNMLDGMIPKTVGYEEQDPEIGIFPTQMNIKKKIKIAMSTSLAFGGTNSALLFRGIK